MIVPQPFFHPRGTPLSVLHRLKALSTLGHRVDLVTYHMGEDIPIENIEIYRTMKIPFIKHINIGPSFKKILCDFFVLLKTIKLLSTKKYDVIHTHEEAGFMAVMLKHFCKIPYIYDMHSSLPQQLENFDRRNFRHFIPLFKCLEKLTINNAMGIITICEDLQNIVKRIAPHKNPVLIENVADNSMVFMDTGLIDVRKKYAIPGDKKIVLYTGTFEEYQGIELLIQSGNYLLKTRNELAYVLVGGKWEQIKRMKILADSYGLGEKIIFTGTVHPREIKYFYEISDIIASPRIKGTNAPLKIYSYLRSGRPIVATDLATHRQVLNRKVAVLARPEPKKFADAVSKLLDDEKVKRRMVFEAKKLVEEKYSYKDYLEKTESVYKAIQTQCANVY
jgi:glycosyltransferase involved in cell wall biosynthesis